MENKKILTTKDFIKDYTGEKTASNLVKECAYNGLVSDISSVDYNKYAIKENVKLEPITDVFCDNVMLYALLKKEDVFLEKSKNR